MINCSCYGHWDIYDKNLREKIQQVLKDLFELDETIQFFFTQKLESFELLCFDLIKELSKQYSDKKIVTTLVIRMGQFEDLENLLELEESDCLALWRNQYSSVCYMYDNVIMPLGVCTFSSSPIEVRHLKRWIIENTDFLLCYEYADLAYERQYIHGLIKRRIDSGTLKIINLTEKSTEAAILNLLTLLTEREHFVRTQILQGKSKREIAQLLGVTYGRVQQIQYNIGRKLREAFTKQLYDTYD